jgi:folate-dependent tRNA-U54 methylase TrmFO/GidA
MDVGQLTAVRVFVEATITSDVTAAPAGTALSRDDDAIAMMVARRVPTSRHDDVTVISKVKA